MAQLTRVLQKIFGETGGTGEFGRIGSDAAGSPTTTKDIATIQSLAQFSQGLFAITDSLNEPPRGQDINALYFLVTRQLAYLFQAGVPEWLSTGEYYAGLSYAVGSDGKLYRSKTGTDGSPNTGNDPVGDTTNWEPGDEAMQQIKASLVGLEGNDIEALIAMRKHDVGEPVFNLLLKTASATFPAVRIDDGDHDISAANWPELVPALRAEQMSVIGVSSFTGTVSGSTITLATSTAGDALLADLVEDAKVHGGDVETENYTNGRSINIAGVDYAITAVNGGARTITVSGSPAAGSQTVLFFPHRIAGSTTTARLFRVSGRSIVAQGDADGTLISGLRRRSFIQGIQFPGALPSGAKWFDVYQQTGGGWPSEVTPGSFADRKTGAPVELLSFGTPRIGKNTEPRALAAYLYIWGGRYVAP